MSQPMRRRTQIAIALASVALVAVVTAAALPGSISAHDGVGAESGDLSTVLGSWSFDAPGVLLTLLFAGLYGWGFLRLRRDSPGFHFPVWHVWAFGLGIGLLILSLVSPIDAYADDLFWVHMIQHMMLVMLIAPLLLLGAPATLALRSASPRVRATYLVPLLNSGVVRFLTHPAVALTLFIAAIWIWHIPTLYDAAIRSDPLHFFEHGAFLGGALLFWWLIVGVDATRLRPAYVTRIAIMILAIIQNLGLALILTTEGDVLYQNYAELALIREWGPDALLDQRIGGGVMWVPGTMMLAIAVLITAYFWAEYEGLRGRKLDLVRELEERTAQSASASNGEQTTEGLRNA